jgi:hypothetical protein
MSSDSDRRSVNVRKIRRYGDLRVGRESCTSARLRHNAPLFAGNFGQITTLAGTPRILQFGIKYGF